MSDEVSPPESDELFDEQTDRDLMVQEAIQKARHYHGVLDAAKKWSRETAAELNVEAALEDNEESAAEIQQIASLVLTVTERIEQGDNGRARQPVGGR